MRSQNEQDDMSIFDFTPESPYQDGDPMELGFDEDSIMDEYAAHQESLLQEEQSVYKQDILHDR